MPDTRPLRIAQKILVEFTVYQLEDGAPITLEQMRHVVKSLPMRLVELSWSPLSLLFPVFL